MSSQPRRIASFVAAASLAGGLVGSSFGSALGSDSTFLSMSSRPGDWVGGSQNYLYTATDATFTPQSDGTYARFSVITPGYEHWWYVNLWAPTGQPLVAGTYVNALRFADTTHPGLDVYGDGRGCNQVAGSFTVDLATDDQANAIVAFDATFEQHCEGGVPTLTGEIAWNAPDVPIPTPSSSPVVTFSPAPSPSASPLPTPTPTPKPSPTPTPTPSAIPTPTPTPTPPPPPTPTPLSVGIAVDPSGTVRNSTNVATVSGLATCTRGVTLAVAGTLTQTVKRGTASGSFATQAVCSSSGTGSWTTTVASTTGKPFGPGTASALVSAAGSDPVTGAHLSASSGGTVSLTTINR